MSNFRIYEPVARLPSIIEVDAVILRQTPSQFNSDQTSLYGTVYMDNGILKYKGTTGTISVIGNR